MRFSSSAPFGVCGYKVISERMHSRASHVQAIVEVRVGQSCVSRSATGVGPVHALDNALRACLTPHFPELQQVRLSDYKVSVIDAADGTGAQVRVMVEATDGSSTWDAGCVSDNVIDASFEALCSTAVMGIMRGSAERLASA
ncbi:MAG: alpha-isopropylmalate synthase regulatory domain-containing protein [Actinomycetota bacterium]